jgi:hypothetical protein
MSDYRVLKAFRDKDSKKHFSVGSLYSAGEERIEFLQEKGFVGEEVSGNANKHEYPKHVGGGHYELSNGEKVKGKDEAAAAEKELSKEGE